MLSYNQLTDMQNLERAPKLTVLDLHNNKLDVLPETICQLYNLKTLTISNNNLSDINPKLSLLDHLVRLTIEGNPLRSIKPSMRTSGAV
jgi:Leucine-rich repeat (LRR) protein